MVFSCGVDSTVGKKELSPLSAKHGLATGYKGVKSCYRYAGEQVQTHDGTARQAANG